MKIHVRLFARLQDLVGSPEVTLEVPEGATVGQLRSALRAAYAQTADANWPLLWAVNDRYAQDADVVTAGDSVACFPPVSGG